jgi:hypothetical protein
MSHYLIFRILSPLGSVIQPSVLGGRRRGGLGRSPGIDVQAAADAPLEVERFVARRLHRLLRHFHQPVDRVDLRFRPRRAAKHVELMARIVAELTRAAVGIAGHHARDFALEQRQSALKLGQGSNC